MTRRAHLIVEHPAWKPRYRPLLRRACTATLDHLGVTQAEFSILCTGDAQLQELNHTFRGKDKPTNVLSFPDGSVEEGVLQLGDIAISLDTLAREAEEQGKRFEDHLTHLIVHGILHLLGHDHERDAEAEAMEGLEAIILHKLKVKNPYR